MVLIWELGLQRKVGWFCTLKNAQCQIRQVNCIHCQYRILTEPTLRLKLGRAQLLNYTAAEESSCACSVLQEIRASDQRQEVTNGILELSFIEGVGEMIASGSSKTWGEPTWGNISIWLKGVHKNLLKKLSLFCSRFSITGCDKLEKTNYRKQSSLWRYNVVKRVKQLQAVCKLFMKVHIKCAITVLWERLQAASTCRNQKRT